MSYDTARAKLVELIEAATPAYSPRGVARTFRECPEADEENPAPERGFTLFGIGDDVRTPLASRRRRVTRLELRVFYRDLANRAEMDRMLRADHKAIGDAIVNPSAWASASSGIISIEQNGGTLIMHADVEPRSDGLLTHVYRFDLEYMS